MFFTKKNGLKKKSEFGRVYILKITLNCGKVVHKVGMTHSDRATDRMFEVLRSFFNTYRYVPECELRRDKKVRIPLLVEKHFHMILDEWSYTPEKSFDGSTEFFHNLDEETVIEYLDNFKYNDLWKGKTEMKESDHEAIKDALNKEDLEKQPKSINKTDNVIPF